MLLQNVNRRQDRDDSVMIGKNKPLVPFGTYLHEENLAQLKNKRQCFWETEPSYSGKAEIWYALRMACEADTIETAQIIVDSAELIFPTGKFTDGCYDNLGNRYVIPEYCIGPVDFTSLEVETKTQDFEKKQSLLEIKEVENFDVKVRLSLGNDIVLNISSEMKIAMLKQLIKEQIAFTPTSIVVIYFGSVLEDSVKIRSTKVDGTAILQAMVIQ
jgi:hypothetical protein